MSLLTREQAAQLIGVPAPWVDAMIEIGALEYEYGQDGTLLFDQDELASKGYIDPAQTAASLGHARALLEKIRRA
jgi:hypothetical protein